MKKVAAELALLAQVIWEKRDPDVVSDVLATAMFVVWVVALLAVTAAYTP